MIRVVWSVWALAWAGAWGWVASLAAPHQVCTEWLALSASGPTCMAYGSSGSWLFTELFAVAAVLSAVSALLPWRR